MSKPRLPTLWILLIAGVIILGLTLYPPWSSGERALVFCPPHGRGYFDMKQLFMEWLVVVMGAAVGAGAIYLVRRDPVARHAAALGAAMIGLARWVRRHKTLAVVVLVFLSLGLVYSLCPACRKAVTSWTSSAWRQATTTPAQEEEARRIVNELRARLGREPTVAEMAAEIVAELRYPIIAPAPTARWQQAPIVAPVPAPPPGFVLDTPVGDIFDQIAPATAPAPSTSKPRLLSDAEAMALPPAPAAKSAPAGPKDEDLVNKARRIQTELRAHLGREPTVAEIVAEINADLGPAPVQTREPPRERPTLINELRVRLGREPTDAEISNELRRRRSLP